jgi:hypothetical protein
MRFACLQHSIFLAIGSLSLLSCGGCGDDGSAPMQEGSGSTSATGSETSTADTTSAPLQCTPGAVRCATSLMGRERCAPTGQLWLPEEPCPDHTTCMPCDGENCIEAQCMGLCDETDDLPSSAGCSFIANRQLHLTQEFNDGLIVANPNMDLDVTVRLMLAPEGTNVEDEIENVVIAPLQAHTFQLSTNFVQSDSSAFRTGGTHRVVSDAPVIAYHHAPYAFSLGNDSSMSLPETAAGLEYVIMSYSPYNNVYVGEPSYFEVVALENFTTVEWFPKVDTAGNGLPVPFVASGGRGELKMNRFDTARIAASGMQQDVVALRDVSGTVVRSDKPIWVTSGTRCARVPVRDLEMYPVGHCDPLQEQPIPTALWGTTYVAAHSPVREMERHWWRIYAGTDGVTIEADSEVPVTGLPVTLEEKGDFVEVDVANGVNFALHSDNGVFMPVQYLQGQIWSGGNPEPPEESTIQGDPSMYQMVPVEQFLDRYVFSTPLNFAQNYVQVTRPIGGPDVTYTDEFGFTQMVMDYEPAGAEFEVANVLLLHEPGVGDDNGQGTYLIESGGPFGIAQVGYSLNTVDPVCLVEEQYQDARGNATIVCPSSYAYPGGMKAEVINIP